MYCIFNEPYIFYKNCYKCFVDHLSADLLDIDELEMDEHACMQLDRGDTFFDVALGRIEPSSALRVLVVCLLLIFTITCILRKVQFRVVLYSSSWE